MPITQTDMQKSLMMLEVARIVSEHNCVHEGRFTIPFDDDFKDFYCVLDCDMIDISTLKRFEE